MLAYHGASVLGLCSVSSRSAASLRAIAHREYSIALLSGGSRLCNDGNGRRARSCGIAQTLRAFGSILRLRSFDQQESAAGGEEFWTFTMWAHPFNHLAAVAAAHEKAAELRARARMLVLAKLVAVVNRGEVTRKQQQLVIRERGLHQFIDDPYPADSLFLIGFEPDRRAILDAGRSLQASVPA